jgi:hypothetical protein
MLRRPVAIAVAAAALAATGVAAVVGGFSSFLGAPAGVPIPYQLVPLPDVAVQRDFVPSISAASALLPMVGLAQVKGSPWQPKLSELLNGNTVVTTEAQMRDVWKRLFAEPYPDALFDFDQDFVVFAGGGQTQLASFSISSIERVDAEYAPAPGFGSFPTSERFLSVTTTHVLPGAFPQDPPPFHYVVSAAVLSRTHLDDAVFHRNIIALP